MTYSRAYISLEAKTGRC